MTDREQRGLVIAATCKLTRKGVAWIVPSQSSQGKYTVCPHEDSPHCTCLDHETRGVKCKHIYAVEYTLKRDYYDNGETVTESVTLTQTVKTTYTQDWRAYNRAQTSEKSTFQVLLRDLCSGIGEPKSNKKGRPPIPMGDAIFSAIFKVYSTVSGRRFMSDLADARDKGHIRRMPCYNSIFNVLESEATFDILRALVVESAAPLKALESNFACDSTGFSGCRFERWFDHKWGEHRIKRSWVKAHAMIGTLTNVVTAVEIHGSMAGDAPQLEPLLRATAENFNVREVSADLAYSTRKNLALVESMGATPFIPFKHNANPSAGGVWAKMFHFFKLNQDEFARHYHQRSNVETTFSMIKAKFGDSVRSKLDIAMKNEVLAKIVSHNICCVIQSMHEFGIEPSYLQPAATA